MTCRCHGETFCPDLICVDFEDDVPVFARRDSEEGRQAIEHEQKIAAGKNIALVDAITNRLLEGDAAKALVPSRKARLELCAEVCLAFSQQREAA